MSGTPAAVAAVRRRALSSVASWPVSAVLTIQPTAFSRSRSSALGRPREMRKTALLLIPAAQSAVEVPSVA